MNEVEIKVAEAIKEIEILLVPMAHNHDVKHSIHSSLDGLREALITAVGRRIIKGTN